MSCLHATQVEPGTAAQLLSELLGRNWRLELDAGLGIGSLVPHEHLLLVCSCEALEALLSELTTQVVQNRNCPELLVNQLTLVEVSGWNVDRPAGAALEPLQSWRDLNPRVCLPTTQQA